MSHDNTPQDNPILAAWREQLERARTNPFLLQLLLKQFQRVLKRLAYFYAQLASLPRRKRRALQRALATSLVGAAMLLALSSAPAVHAASITVSGPCTLDEAITNANNDAATFPDCAAGSGADTIYLTGNVVVGFGGLPAVSSEITLEGGNFSVSGGTVYQVFRVSSTGDFTINDTTIRDGYAANGGGIFNDGFLEINNSTLSGNRASVDGGAIYNNDGDTVIINNSTLSGNSATSDGAVMYNDDYSIATINNSTLSGNSVDNRGGAIFNNRYITLTIANSTLSGNTAQYEGGAIYNLANTTMTITNSTFSGNSAGNNGGAIYNDGYTDVTLTNSTFSGNSAVRGGAIFNDENATTNLNRSLLSGNTATGNGDEIFNYSGGTINATNFNLFGNSAISNADAFSNFTPVASDITATSDGTLPTALASILDTTLADNGSSITTPSGVVQTLALESGSPALDKAPNTDCTAAVGAPLFGAGGLDQRAFPRNVDFVPPPSANDCDIGAFELQVTTAVNVAGVNARVNAKHHVAVKWRTLSESQIAGFNVYRKTGKGEWKQVNAKFKQAKNSGDAQGNRYAFRDKKVKPKKVYRYKIQVMYLDGHHEWTDIAKVKTP